MSYIPVLVMMVIGLGLGGVILLMTTLIGPQVKHPMKDQPFECGVPPLGVLADRILPVSAWRSATCRSPAMPAESTRVSAICSPPRAVTRR